MLVDSHCHLHDAAFDADRDAVIERAQQAGVQRIITIGTSIADSRAAIALAEVHADVWATVGIAPHAAEPLTADALRALRDLAQHPKVVALGEFGLDYHYDNWPRTQQREIFEQQLALAADLGKPVVIHNRDADDDILAMLREFTIQHSALSTQHSFGVMHCFSSTLALAQACAALGLLISIAGPITYPKPRALPEIVRTLSLDALLIETDAPFLAPQAQRGRRNEPAHVRAVATKIAELRSESFERVAKATTRNAEKLFAVA